MSETMGLLEELAVRCEAATEGTPMLENEIAKLLHEDGWHVADCMRQFTRSIDAATSLVPATWEWGCGHKDATGQPWAWVGEPVPDGADWDPMRIANAATPALALTAASLRARHALALSKGSDV